MAFTKEITARSGRMCKPKCAAQRASFSVRGSDTIENDRRGCFYWTDAEELVFRTPDNRRLALFKREPDGILIDRMPGLTADLQPAAHGDGRTGPTMSTFSLADAVGTQLFEITVSVKPVPSRH